MPRRARIAVAGVPWHIIQRGNNRTDCFLRAKDYIKFLDILTQNAADCGCKVHAYVLMSNHTHLLVTPSEIDSVPNLMKHLGQRYVQYFNRTHKRSGTLWEGRFRSCITQSARYIFACYQYIELNPVRAGMVTRPGDYPWSSFGCNGLGHSDALVTPHEVYMGLGKTNSERRHEYRARFHARLDDQLIDNLRRATNGNYVLGTAKFLKETSSKLGARVIPGKPGHRKR